MLGCWHLFCFFCCSWYGLDTLILEYCRYSVDSHSVQSYTSTSTWPGLPGRWGGGVWQSGCEEKCFCFLMSFECSCGCLELFWKNCWRPLPYTTVPGSFLVAPLRSDWCDAKVVSSWLVFAKWAWTIQGHPLGFARWWSWNGRWGHGCFLNPWVPGDIENSPRWSLLKIRKSLNHRITAWFEQDLLMRAAGGLEVLFRILVSVNDLCISLHSLFPESYRISCNTFSVSFPKL